MDLQRIVSQLKSERARIDRAIAALQGTRIAVASRKKAGPVRTARASSKRRMSAEARKRISEGMKKRWADRRKGNGRRMSAQAA
jgi:hypothetical protein